MTKVKFSTLKKGLIGHWLSSNNYYISGGQNYIIDKSIFGNDGLVNGSLIFGTNHKNLPNSAMYFDGSTNYINLGELNVLKNLNQFAYSSWIYMLSGMTQNPRWFDNSTASIRIVPNLTLQTMAFYLNSQGMSPAYTWSNNRWYHIVCNYNKVSMNIYINNTYIGTKVYSSAITNSSTDVTLGADNNAIHDAKHKGYMSNVKIWNRALTLQEIDFLYKKG